MEPQVELSVHRGLLEEHTIRPGEEGGGLTGNRKEETHDKTPGEKGGGLTGNRKEETHDKTPGEEGGGFIGNRKEETHDKTPGEEGEGSQETGRRKHTIRPRARRGRAHRKQEGGNTR
ncbi:hypothetical protein NHX12_009753 [Muraenolepis orangiensis]|uniref:Uncharacterized protein n=1 Tax=Muraenolepis orangiensis TaxID=630683 RepID=A0A9Q0DI88_9TELE|nr:hypothetical protein NHX12_009753 [Muraenolepis orangiensis]